jgi:hypothetical protein
MKKQLAPPNSECVKVMVRLRPLDHREKSRGTNFIILFPFLTYIPIFYNLKNCFSSIFYFGLQIFSFHEKSNELKFEI